MGKKKYWSFIQFFMFNDLRWRVIVNVDDIGWIVNQSLFTPFHKEANFINYVIRKNQMVPV